MKTKRQAVLQIIWGALLLIVGLGLFFRISQVMPEIQQIEAYSSDIPFKKFSLYLIGFFLAGGGIKKIWENSTFLRQGRDKLPPNG